MALSLAEAAKLSNDVLLQGVIETIIYDSPVLQVLPFIEIVGNGLTYNQENQAPTVAFYDVGDTWAESTPTFTQQIATLKIMGGKPEMLLMSKRSRRKLTALSRGSGSGIMEFDRNQFGQMVQYYSGIPIGVNDWISDARTVGVSTDCSTIYAVCYGEGATAGLTAPGGLLVEGVGSLETKDASRTRGKWYVSLALFNHLRLAKLIG